MSNVHLSLGRFALSFELKAYDLDVIIEDGVFCP